MTNDITPMTAEAAQEWIDALKGTFWDKKGKGFLMDENGCFCCLGVFAALRGDLDVDNSRGKKVGTIGNQHTILPVEWGLSGKQQDTLWRVNDNSETFAPVISEIRRMFIDKAS